MNENLELHETINFVLSVIVFALWLLYWFILELLQLIKNEAEPIIDESSFCYGANHNFHRGPGPAELVPQNFWTGWSALCFDSKIIITVLPQEYMICALAVLRQHHGRVAEFAGTAMTLVKQCIAANRLASCEIPKLLALWRPSWLWVQDKDPHTWQ